MKRLLVDWYLPHYLVVLGWLLACTFTIQVSEFDHTTTSAISNDNQPSFLSWPSYNHCPLLIDRKRCCGQSHTIVTISTISIHVTLS
jgi:hypothetical protein